MADTNSIVSYLWSTGETTASITVSSQNQFSVEMVNTSGCSANASISVFVNSVPTVTLDPFGLLCSDSGPLLLSGGTPSGGTYTGNSVINNFFHPSIGLGTYTINYAYTDGNGCSASSQGDITVDICAGLNLRNDADDEIRIYPNPAHDVLNIFIPNNSETIVELMDATGKLLQKKLYKGKHLLTEQINITDYAEGIYSVRIVQDGSVKIYKVAIN